MSRRAQTTRLAICALVFMAFGSVGVQMIGIVSENTDWLAIGYPVATAPDGPDDHQIEIPVADIVVADPEDHAVVLNFADGETPRIFADGTIGIQLGAGDEGSPSGLAASSSAGAPSNGGDSIALFLTDDEEPGPAVATAPPGATSAISTPLVADAANAPIRDFIPIATLDPGEKSAKLELGRKGEPPRHPR